MDPLSLTVVCGSLAAAIAKTSIVVTKFVRDVRGARSDLDAISRELVSLNTVLELLADDVANPENGTFPDTLRKQINGIVTNCTGVVIEIERVVEQHEGSKLVKAARWATIGHDDMMKLRSSLEAHKSALEIALEMIALTLAREIKADTQEILHDTSAIKEDTEHILAEIARLQGQLPRDVGRGNTNGYMLERYLCNLTTYAETVCDSISDEIIPPVAKRSKDTKLAGDLASDDKHEESQDALADSKASHLPARTGKSVFDAVDDINNNSIFKSTQSTSTSSDYWWDNKKEIPVRGLPTTIASWPRVEGLQSTPASPSSDSASPHRHRGDEWHQEEAQTVDSIVKDSPYVSPHSELHPRRTTPLKVDEDQKTEPAAITSHEASLIRDRQEALSGAAKRTAFSSLSNYHDFSDTDEKSPTKRLGERQRSPSKAELLLGERLDKVMSKNGQLDLRPDSPKAEIILKQNFTKHYPADASALRKLSFHAYHTEPNEYNHIRYSALTFQPAELGITGNSLNLRQLLRQPPRKITIFLSIYVPSNLVTLADPLMVTIRSLKESLDKLIGQEEFYWRTVCVGIVSEAHPLAATRTVSRDLGIFVGGDETMVDAKSVVAHLHEASAFLPFGKEKKPMQIVFVERVDDGRGPELMKWVEAIEGELKPRLGIRLYAGTKVRADALMELWDTAKRDGEGKTRLVTYKESKPKSFAKTWKSKFQNTQDKEKVDLGLF